MTKILREGFFREGTAYAAVAVFERVNTHEVQMGNAGARQRRQRGLASGGSIVEPRNELHHLVRQTAGRRSLEMHRGFMDRARDNLHGFGVRPVAANSLDGSIAAQHHAVPVERLSVSASAKLR